MVEDASVKTSSENTEERFVAPWASGESLRVIERDVLIPNLMKKKAKVLCKDYMDSFSDCVRGRTISMAWACGKETKAMKECLKQQLENKELFEESRKEYLMERGEFQKSYVETGKTKRIKKKMSAF